MDLPSDTSNDIRQLMKELRRVRILFGVSIIILSVILMMIAPIVIRSWYSTFIPEETGAAMNATMMPAGHHAMPKSSATTSSPVQSSASSNSAATTTIVASSSATL